MEENPKTVEELDRRIDQRQESLEKRNRNFLWRHLIPWKLIGGLIVLIVVVIIYLLSKIF